MSMRNVTTQMDRDGWDAKERFQRRLEAMDGIHVPDICRGCLCLEEHENLNHVAAVTRDLRTPEAEALARIREVARRIARIRQTGFCVVYPVEEAP